MSESRIGINKLAVQQHNPVDVKPKSTNLIEPGEGFEPREEKTVDDSEADQDPDQETLQALDQLANRNFVVRRGRNNRILAKAIVKNVFDDTQTEGEKAEKAKNSRG